MVICGYRNEETILWWQEVDRNVALYENIIVLMTGITILMQLTTRDDNSWEQCLHRKGLVK